MTFQRLEFYILNVLIPMHDFLQKSLVLLAYGSRERGSIKRIIINDKVLFHMDIHYPTIVTLIEFIYKGSHAYSSFSIVLSHRTLNSTRSLWRSLYHCH